MKKFISAIISAAMLIPAAGAYAVPAGADSTDPAIIVFGDSIAAGYGLDPASEYTYAQICADYLGCGYENYAVSGHTTSDMLNVISSLSTEQKNAVASSDYIVISIGGNDLMHYAAQYLLTYAAEQKLLKDGYSAADIPADPSVSELLRLLDIDKVQAFASNTTNALELISTLKKLCNNLKTKTDKYEGIIPEKVIPNIQTAVNELKDINPNARIIVQTIYQPLQIDPEYISEKYGSDSSYTSLIGQLRSNFKGVLDTFRTDLAGVEDIEIADVYYEFTSIADGVTQTNANPGHANYFTNIQLPGEERDFHPNQKGHLAIAATILNTIGDLHDDSGLLSDIYKSLNDYSDYPSIALDTYKKAAGKLMTGDVNFDEKIDARDASLVLKNYTFISEDPASSILSELQSGTSDVNRDDSSDAKDATAILRYYAYLQDNGTASLEEFLAQ